MAASPSWELQEAIVTALKADATIQSYVGTKVYDAPPNNVAEPYIVYDEGDMDEWDVTPIETVSGDGKEHSISIHVWSSYEGYKEAKTILQRVHELLQAQDFVLTDHNLVNLRFVNAFFLRDPDGQTRHGMYRYRAITEET